MFDGKRILVTGGTGSLGRALLRRAHDQGWGAEFVIFSRDETKQSELKKLYPEHTYLLGDVAKIRDVHRAMVGVDFVFHFAAYKQVPSAQNNVAATVETNVIGSQNIVDAALQAGVTAAVASSTDKACFCANYYGASKFLMEGIFQNGNRHGLTKFHLTRYGNVLSSNQSVVPFWKKQMARGEPITVTDRRMTRFWLTLDQAVDLILQALLVSPGVIVVPKAPAMSVYELAKAIAGEYPIIETEIRPGEKLTEAMVSEAESFHTEEKETHFLIYPSTSDFRNPNAPFSYTSDNPDKFLSAKEMLAMLAETEQKWAY